MGLRFLWGWRILHVILLTHEWFCDVASRARVGSCLNSSLLVFRLQCHSALVCIVDDGCNPIVTSGWCCQFVGVGFGGIQLIDMSCIMGMYAEWVVGEELEQRRRTP